MPYVFFPFEIEIFQGAFNCAVCPDCETALYAETRFVYRDEEKKIWVWVCKENDDIEDKYFVEEFLKNTLPAGHFIDNQNDYSLHVVKGLDGLLSVVTSEGERPG
ncbi:MAG: hypothetical protein JRJ51_06860 [Deltaproteobacteria bacterium]|nr:hypothetical protein [Deltaproteobacteria bacterium]MBW1942537.1 hypothetical protein [Deltaproteobacteria bacterium]